MLLWNLANWGYFRVKHWLCTVAAIVLVHRFVSEYWLVLRWKIIKEFLLVVLVYRLNGWSVFGLNLAPRPNLVVDDLALHDVLIIYPEIIQVIHLNDCRWKKSGSIVLSVWAINMRKVVISWLDGLCHCISKTVVHVDHVLIVLSHILILRTEDVLDRIAYEDPLLVVHHRHSLLDGLNADRCRLIHNIWSLLGGVVTIYHHLLQLIQLLFVVLLLEYDGHLILVLSRLRLLSFASFWFSVDALGCDYALLSLKLIIFTTGLGLRLWLERSGLHSMHHIWTGWKLS